VPEWIPSTRSAKGRLALTALEEFGTRGYEAVNVVDLAHTAGVTTGSLYHHFGSKLGLYGVVREEAERRALDRMEGAAAARAEDGPAAAARAALLVGFDYVVRRGFTRLLGEGHPDRGDDPIEAFLSTLTDADDVPVARLLLAAWRAALAAVADGAPVERVRSAFAAF
jgi:AcrR family transcriptional regulator